MIVERFFHFFACHPSMRKSGCVPLFCVVVNDVFQVGFQVFHLCFFDTKGQVDLRLPEMSADEMSGDERSISAVRNGWMKPACRRAALPDLQLPKPPRHACRLCFSTGLILEPVAPSRCQHSDQHEDHHYRL